MWPRRVLPVFAELHLHAFIIPDADSHPARAGFVLNSAELTETTKKLTVKQEKGGGSHISALLLKAHPTRFLMISSLA